MTGTLRPAAAGYLQTRRSLGYQLQAHGRLLMSYIADLEASGQTTVTAANAVAWATGASPVWHARRLSVARCFARYLSATDPSCQVPPAWLLPARYRRAAPYIYTQQQIDALVHAAGTLGSPLPAASCQAVISLLAATGLRIGEAIALTRADADLDGGIITVVNGKHGASRHVPLHPSVTRMLRRYAERRDRLCPAPRCDRFFITRAGTPLSPGQLQDAFARLLVHAGITVPAGQRPPRIHD
jgi:site-specific recombinase XerD